MLRTICLHSPAIDRQSTVEPSSMSMRQAAVAGVFYPDQAAILQNTLRHLLDQAGALANTQADAYANANAGKSSVKPNAIIVPHAGYIYSGTIAATAYQALMPWRSEIHSIALLGPSHRVALDGMALSTASHFVTPLGKIPLDDDTQQALLAKNEFPLTYMDAAHAFEHSLEVQLPFLQQVLSSFSIIPIVIGDCSAEPVAKLIRQLWQQDILTVISSDLSHFLSYAMANQKDHDTIAHILQLDHALHGDQACGCRPINGLLLAAEEQALQIQCLAYANSGDSSACDNIDEGKQRVVGYGAFSLYRQ